MVVLETGSGVASKLAVMRVQRCNHNGIGFILVGWTVLDEPMERVKNGRAEDTAVAMDSFNSSIEAGHFNRDMSTTGIHSTDQETLARGLRQNKLPADVTDDMALPLPLPLGMSNPTHNASTYGKHSKHRRGSSGSNRLGPVSRRSVEDNYPATGDSLNTRS